MATLKEPAQLGAEAAERTTVLRAEARATAPPARPERAGQPESPGRPRGRRRRGLVLTLLAVLLLAGLGGGAWWYLDGRYTSTPGVLGLSRADAQAELTDAGLEVEWGDKAYSETVPAGRVVSTDPGPGDQVLDGGTVTVTLSLGKERYDVPKLAGMTEDKAQDALAATDLGFGSTTEAWSDTVPAGRVISSSPKAGTTLRPDTPVDLVVSKGPKPVKLKDWVGRSADDAMAWLEARG